MLTTNELISKLTTALTLDPTLWVTDTEHQSTYLGNLYTNTPGGPFACSTDITVREIIGGQQYQIVWDGEDIRVEPATVEDALNYIMDIEDRVTRRLYD